MLGTSTHILFLGKELRALDCICTKVSLAAWEYLESWHLVWLLAMMVVPALVSLGLWWVSFLLSRGKHLMPLLAFLLSLVLTLINNEITGSRLSKSISLACGTTQFENKNKSNAREAKWMQIKVWRNLLAPIRLFCFLSPLNEMNTAFWSSDVNHSPFWRDLITTLSSLRKRLSSLG